MRLSRESKELIRLDDIKATQEISAKHHQAVHRIEETTPRGGAMRAAIDGEYVQMAKELAQSKVALYLEAFRRENVIPSEADISEIYAEVEEVVRSISHNTHHPPLPSSQDAYMTIAPSARMDLIRSAKRMQLEQRSSAAQVPANQQALQVTKKSSLPFVAEDRIAELRGLNSTKFDLGRLIRFCEELNIGHAEGCYFALAFLVRALLDHVPPIFGKATFAGVANNYAGKSVKEQLRRLDNAARKIADGHLHQPIRPSETLPTAQQVNFSAELDVLLSEIVRQLK